MYGKTGRAPMFDFRLFAPVVSWRLTIILKRLSIMSIKRIKLSEFYLILHKTGKWNSINSDIIVNLNVLSDFLLPNLLKMNVEKRCTTNWLYTIASFYWSLMPVNSFIYFSFLFLDLPQMLVWWRLTGRSKISGKQQSED